MSLLPTEKNAVRLADSLSTKGAALAATSQLKSVEPECHRDTPVRQILKRCGEYARAGAVLGKSNNPTSLAILARASLENLILILWVVVSETNATELRAATLAALTRAALVNLQSGNAKIKNRITGEDATTRILADDRFKKLPKRKSVESRAKEAGVLDLYDVFYRFLSLETHGHDLARGDAPGEWAQAVSHMQGMGALTTAIGHVGTLWLLGRMRVDNETLRGLLGLG